MRSLTFFIGIVVAAAQACAVDAVVVNRGNEKLAAGEIEGAIKIYEQVSATDSSAGVTYNLGVARFRKGDLAGARSAFAKAMNSKDRSLAAKASFNLGNCDYCEAVAAAKQQTPQSMDTVPIIKRLKSAIGHYRNSLRIDPSDSDTRQNIELAVKWLDELEQKDQSDPSDQSDGNQTDQSDPSNQDTSNQPQQDPSDQADESDQTDQSSKDPTDQSDPTNQSDQSKHDPSDQSDQADPTDQSQKDQSDPTDQSEQDPTDQTDPSVQPGDPISQQEAMKMLQAIRDREFVRRLQHIRRMQLRSVPVDKDW